MRRNSLQLLALSLLCCTALGQEAKKHTCRILFLERPSSAPQTLHLFDGTSSREVELPGLNLSQVYELPPGKLSISLLPVPIANPEDLPPGAPTTAIPEGVADFYLLVTSDPSNNVAPVRMQVIEAGKGSLRRGQMLWINLTDHLVGGQLGSEKLLIKPQSRTTLNPPAKGATDFPVSLAYRIRGDERMYPICETRWLHDPRSRSLAFIFNQREGRAPRILVFPDFRQEEKNDPAD
ncbi:hypothetical protein HZ994_02030 [Akkermansiaceae bacterium]|nr:hypothetical protein HZ994_02030 [Akkermansiaceae bacterium]